MRWNLCTLCTCKECRDFNAWCTHLEWMMQASSTLPASSVQRFLRHAFKRPCSRNARLSLSRPLSFWCWNAWPSLINRRERRQRQTRETEDMRDRRHATHAMPQARHTPEHIEHTEHTQHTHRAAILVRVGYFLEGNWGTTCTQIHFIRLPNEIIFVVRAKVKFERFSFEVFLWGCGGGTHTSTYQRWYVPLTDAPCLCDWLTWTPRCLRPFTLQVVGCSSRGVGVWCVRRRFHASSGWQ